MYSIHGKDFIDGFLGFNNVTRATVSEHPEYDVWYYYLVLVPVSLLPWTGPCLYGLWRRRSHHDEYVFMAIWPRDNPVLQPHGNEIPDLCLYRQLASLIPGRRTMQAWLDEDARYAWLAASSRPPSTACSSPYWWPLRMKRLSPSKACCC